jgi:hypothetical protein
MYKMANSKKGTSSDIKALETELKDLDSKRVIVKEALNRDRLNEITNNIIETISSPKFMERMKSFRDKAAVEGVDFAEAGNIMSIESLKEAGATIPDDFRLTSRVFEDREIGLKIEFNDPKRRIMDVGPVAVGACGGAGGLSFCACGGGST